MGLHSPNFPGSYHDNAYVYQEIRVQQGFVISVSLLTLDSENEADYLYIGDGADSFNKVSPRWRKFTGTLKQSLHFKSTSPWIVIIFTSDGNETAQGFTLECFAGKQYYTYAMEFNIL